MFIGITEFEFNSAGIKSFSNVACLKNATVFAIRDNPISSIDVSGLTSIDNLTIRDTDIATLDLTALSALRLLWVHRNQLTDLDVRTNSNLEFIQANNNRLPSVVLDQIVIDLDSHGKSNGEVRLADNSGGLTAASYDSCQRLITKGWSIDVICSPIDCASGSTYNGTICEDDDECIGEGVGNNCDVNAVCTNTDGSFTCACNSGYTGDGTSCIPDGIPSAHATLFGFRVEDSNPDRLFFDSDSPLTNADWTGFSIQGRAVVGINANGANTTGHYLTMAAPFTFWDNNLIRFDGSSNSMNVDSFTLQFVTNNMSEPSNPVGNHRYVATNGGNGAGTAGDPWSIEHAASTATAGMTVWIKAGTYTSANLVLANNGSPTAPIKFIGYKTTVGDAPYLPRTTGMSFTASEMPLLTGGSDNTAINANGRSHVIIKNIQIYDYGTTDGRGITLDTSGGVDASYIHIHNVYIDQVKASIWNNQAWDSAGFRISRVYCANGSHDGINIDGTAHMIDDAYVCSTPAGVGGMDYYISVHGSETPGRGYGHSVRNSYLYRDLGDSHTGHGIAIKAKTVDAALEYGLYENNEIVNMRNGAIEFRHSGTRFNVVRNIYAHAEGDPDVYGFSGINFENGATDNIVENCTIANQRYGSNFTENEEDLSGTQAGGHRNTIINTLYYDCKFMIGAGVSSPGESYQDVNTNNKWINCTFHNAVAMFARSDGLTDVYFDNTNEFVNCIVSGVSTKMASGHPDPSWDHNDFWSSFAAEGTNVINTDPLFVDFVDFVPQASSLKAGIPMADVRRDRNGKLRDEVAPTIGAVEID
jgi:EGF domain